MMRQSTQLNGHPANRPESSTVEILSKQVKPTDGDKEKVVLYGFVENSQSQIAGFTLCCMVSWMEQDMSFESEDNMAERYFEELIKKHIDSNLLISDAVFELTFSNPEFGAPVGHGSGFVRFYGGFQN